MGDLNARPDYRHAYRLPFTTGEAYQIVQGYNGAFSHKGRMRYALDFEMPEGTPIFAAREGAVVEVIQDFTAGGVYPELKDKVNRVLIRHKDGTVGGYYHLRFHGAVVSPSDRVSTGQLIGYSGNTGYTQFPHLHFEVQRPDYSRGTQTMPTRFVTKESPSTPVVLQEGGFYYAADAPLQVVPGEGDPPRPENDRSK